MTDDLRALCGAYGVATEYWDWRNERVDVSDATLRAVLTALGVESSDPAAALRAQRDQAWRRLLPPYVITRTGQAGEVEAHAPAGVSLELWLLPESGAAPVELTPTRGSTREVDGVAIVRHKAAVPDDLPVGYHALAARCGKQTAGSTLIVAPAWLGMPAAAGARPVWGLATQLYSVRSRRSWGIGDLADLADLATWAGAEHGAGFVLVNPLHAAEPVPPIEASPYLPVSRRYGNPIYLRIERVAEYADLAPNERAEIEAAAATVDRSAELIDRDEVWTAKRRALETLFGHGREPGRELAHQAYLRREGDALRDFAAWCVLAETHGPNWREWPEPLRHAGSREVAAFVAEHPDEIAFYAWLQWLLDEQLAAAQLAATSAGMALGIVHDLAVGVSRVGADSWTLRDVFAEGMSVGAPPDAYAQTGQDWHQPPWRPDRLAELAYAPLRELVAGVLRHAGGLRIDHVLGMFRLWWIPDGATATDGTYVRYDHDAAIGVLAVEAARAGAVLVGEDLGTVEPWVRDYLAERGLLGTSVLWFERDWDGDKLPIDPTAWREYCLASVTTHDLPPTAGYLAGDHVRLRDELGLLTRPLAEELAADRAEQADWIAFLRRRGLLAGGVDDASADDPRAISLALHRALATAPSRLRSLALTDAVGDRRIQNQPGATEGYPNWRMPLTDPDGRPVLLEDIFSSDRAARLAGAVARTGPQ